MKFVILFIFVLPAFHFNALPQQGPAKSNATKPTPTQSIPTQSIPTQPTLTQPTLTQSTLTLEQRRLLDSIVTLDVPPGAPGIATCIVKNGKLIYENYSGFADLEDKSLINRNTRFNLASNGKQFTALAALVLMDQGKLNLHDDIRQFLPSLFKKITQKISVEHLLTHTSGIRDVYDLWALQGITWWKQTYSNSDAISLLEGQAELNFMPGSRYSYSNSNYILLAKIIEKVSGKPFEVFTAGLFRTIGMNATSFEPEHTKITGPVAKPYFNFSTWTKTEWIWNVQGDGNFFSTMADQIRWEQLLHSPGNGRLSKELLEKSQHLLNDKMRNYGYGLEFGEYRRLPYTFHEGATGAWKATVVRFPKQQLTILTFTNSGKTIPSMQTRQMADVMLGHFGKTETFQTRPANIGELFTEDELPGLYQTASGFIMEIEKRDSSLFLKRFGRNDIRLRRESPNVFHQWNDSAFKQEFTRNSSGEMQLAVYYTTHPPYTLTRPKINWESFSFTSPEGFFVNSETGVGIRIKYDSARSYSIELNGKIRKGILTTPTQMIMDNYRLEFAGASGTIKTIYLNGDRIMNVRFEKE